MIAELLRVGAENPTTGRQLADVIGCDIRAITAAIERERRAGAPICAAVGDNPGYYLAESEEELQRYCNRLHHRAAELYKTRQALLNVLQKYAAKREAAEEARTLAQK